MSDPRIEAAARALNIEGWTCFGGVHEPGEYGKCHACTLICNEVATAAIAAIDKAATITTVEELDALPEESVIRSVAFGVVRERMDSGWLSTGYEDFEQSEDIAGREHRVIHRGTE